MHTDVKIQDRIPFEVWTEVLLLLGPKWAVISPGRIQTPELAKLSRVCKTWRNVLKECGRFWANIEVQVSLGFKGNEADFLALLDNFKHYVARSKSAPLHLTISWAYHGGDRPMQTERLLDVVLAHAHRWQSVTLDVGGWNQAHCHGFDHIAIHLPEMTSLSSLAMENVRDGTGPWLPWLKGLLKHVPGNTLGWTSLKELRLDSDCWHRDAFYQHFNPNPYTSNTLTHVEAHVALLAAVSMVEDFPALVEASFTFTEPRREVWGAYVRESPVVHNHLRRLTVRTTPFLQALVRRTFPHSPLSSILHQLTLPRLSHLGVCVNPGHAVLPVELEAPSKDTEYARHLMESEDWDESRPDSEDEMNQYLGVQEDRLWDPPARYKKGFVFKRVKDKGRMFRSTLEDPFFPDHLDGFLSRSPLLESLELVAIPFKGPQLIRVLEKTPNLVQISLREVAVLREEEKLYPEPLANDALLNWLGDTFHLPHLNSIFLHLTRYPPTTGSLESMLETRYAVVNNSAHVLKCVEVDCEEIDHTGNRKFDYARLEALQSAGLLIIARFYECRQLGKQYKQHAQRERDTRTNFCLSKSLIVRHA
ncbi:hypothetical protein AAF712_008552 [Marasmius tenuissimus]|uniref:F-box domain-containing protein n=1 Tax=Marasmius tenuissimus TaxID=585030 RepID=A0ABR2ZUI5_9AGAR